MIIKRSLKRVLSSRWLTPIWEPLTTGRVTIFTLHRFAMPELGVAGHDPDVLRSGLDRLRRERYNLISLREAIEQMREGREIAPRTVVFTVDDGYADFGHVGAPVFMEYDCPVTVFLSTGFVEGSLWHWWDQLAFVLRSTARQRMEVPNGSGPLRIDLSSDSARHRAIEDLVLACTRCPDEVKWEFIHRLADVGDVPIPAGPPARYAPLTWGEVRALEQRGVDFGPHTVSHPVLVNTSDAAAAWQIQESWRTILARLERPVPIFAYPNGDYGHREIDLLIAAEIAAGLTTVPVHASVAAFHRDASGPYQIPRFPYPDDVDGLCIAASGFGRIAQGVRRVVRPRSKPRRSSMLIGSTANKPVTPFHDGAHALP